MTEEQNKPQNIQDPLLNANEDEIDLIALAKTAWNGRKTIINTTIVFSIIGLFIAIYTPRQYKVTSIMVPQVSSGQNKLGGLSSLAAMAGFSLDMSSGSDFSPMIYPQIVQSTPFQLELMQAKLNFNGYNKKISYYDYYTDPQYVNFNPLNFIKKYTIGLPSIIIGLPRKILNALRGKPTEILQINVNKDEIIQLSIKEKRVLNSLASTVKLFVNKRDGIITLECIMKEANATAQLGYFAQTLLQKKIIEFKIEKANNQLEFVQERYNERKKDFKVIQNKLALAQDRNKYIISAVNATEQERLQSEYQLSLSVFTELAKQLEGARINVQEETPVFSIIEPISIPKSSFKPKRIQILFTWGFLGGILGVGLVLGRIYFALIKKRWKQDR